MEPRARGMSERKLLEDASVQGGDAMQDLVTNGKQLFHKLLFRWVFHAGTQMCFIWDGF